MTNGVYRVRIQTMKRGGANRTGAKMNGRQNNMNKSVWIVVTMSAAGRIVPGGCARFDKESEARKHRDAMEKAGLIAYYKEIAA